MAGIVKPSGPTTGSVKPVTLDGAADGACAAHSSGRNPTTRLTPVTVLRSAATRVTAATRSATSTPSRRSNSR